MKIEYSKEADALYVYFKEEYVAKSKEIQDGVVVDFDEKAQLIGIEVLDVSQRFSLSDIVNVSIMKIQMEDYALFLIAGLFPWQWFSNSVNVAPMVFLGAQGKDNREA